jgi:hypothetical protein
VPDAKKYSNIGRITLAPNVLTKEFIDGISAKRSLKVTN